MPSKTGKNILGAVLGTLPKNMSYSYALAAPTGWPELLKNEVYERKYAKHKALFWIVLRLLGICLALYINIRLNLLIKACGWIPI